MSLIRKKTECEICRNKKFLNSLTCDHKICLDCKIMIKKIEINPKCPYCRILFDPSKKVIESDSKEKYAQSPFDINQLIADLSWEAYSSDKRNEYNSELDENRIW